MVLEISRRKKRRTQFKINKKIKKSFYKNIAFHPCCYCKSVFLMKDLTVEHLFPLSWGGTNDISNIDLACSPCNQKRGKESWFLKKDMLKEIYNNK